MGKRKNNNAGARPTQSFQQLVANATEAKLSGYIDSKVQLLGQAILERSSRSNENMMTRIMAIEETIMEIAPSVNKETLANKVAVIQDRHEGFEEVNDGVAELGDRVRIEIKTRTADQAEFQGSSRLQIDNIGEGLTLGKELESAMLGIKPGDTKEIKFGKDDSLVASVTLNRLSRQPKQEVPVPPISSQEVADASPNAG